MVTILMTETYEYGSRQFVKPLVSVSNSMEFSFNLATQTPHIKYSFYKATYQISKAQAF